MTEEQNNQSKILAPPPPPPPPQPKLKPTSASQSQKAIQGKCESRSKLLSPLIERAISSLQVLCPFLFLKFSTFKVTENWRRIITQYLFFFSSLVAKRKWK